MTRIWNSGGQPLVGPNRNQNLRRLSQVGPQIDTRHYSLSQIRNMAAVYAAGGLIALAQAGYPADIVNNYASGSWDGASSVVASDSNHITTMSIVSDPVGSGHVIKFLIDPDYAVAPLFGGARAEIAWDGGSGGTTLGYAIGGNPIWEAFAFYLPSSINTGNSAFIVKQSHTRLSGDTSPDVAYEIWPYYGLFTISTAYSPENPTFDSGSGTWQPQSNHQVNLYGNNQGSGSPVPQAIPGYDQWIYIIQRKVAGYQSSQNPQTDVWMSLDGVTYSHIVNANTSPNTYNTTSSGLLPSYPRQAIYYYQTSNPTGAPWPPLSQVPVLMTPAYWQEEIGGVSLLANAKAAIFPAGH